MPNAEVCSARVAMKASAKTASVIQYSATCVRESASAKPNADVKPVSPLKPPVNCCWLTMNVAAASVSACVMIAKYEPVTRRRNTRYERAAATAPGTSTTATIATTGERNGAHHHGSASSPLHCMKSGTPPGSVPASLRCIASA